MPVVKATALLTGVTPDPSGPPVVYAWKATLAWSGAGCAFSAGRTFRHPDMTAQGPGNTFVLPFSKLCGGDLTVTVTVHSGATTISATAGNLKVTATNPSIEALAAAAPAITAFRKLMRLESSLRQFRGPSCPLFSADGLGGAGLCQLTRPLPSDDQVWSWKANLAAGFDLYKSKQELAASHPASVRSSAEFQAQVRAYNAGRPTGSAGPLAIELPDYTDEQLQRDTLRGFNGYAGGLHEYRVKLDQNGQLVVTIDPSGKKGSAEWEQISAAERIAYYDSINIPENKRGDPNYVTAVEAEAAF